MSLIRIRPLGKQVLILPDALATESKGGILLPDNRHGDSVGWGTVAACGPDAHGIESGDRIYFKRGHGTVIMIDTVQHWMVNGDQEAGICLMVERDD